MTKSARPKSIVVKNIQANKKLPKYSPKFLATRTSVLKAFKEQNVVIEKKRSVKDINPKVFQ